MNESSTISTYLRTETDEVKEFSSNIMTQRKKIPQLKNLISPRKSKQVKFNPIIDSVRSSQSQRSSKGNLGLQTQNNNMIFKDSFELFLDGKITSVELLQLSNYPRLRQQLMEDHADSKGISILGPLVRFKNKFKHKQVRNTQDDRSVYLKSKLQGLNNLIHTRMMQKKEDNETQRRQNLQNVGLFKTIVDASEGIEDKLAQTKDPFAKKIPSIRSLKTMTVSYDDLKPIIKNAKESPAISKIFLKNNLTESTKKYMDEASRQHYLKQQELNKLTKMQITKQSNSKFSLYNKDVLTSKDLELYDYLHNKPKPIVLRNHFTEMDEETIPTHEIIATKIGNQRLKKRYHKTEQKIHEDLDNESHTSSLQSTYEIHLDNLYSQTVDLKKQLTKKTTLPKKVKQMIKLDELNQQSLQANTFKLTH
ncbi:unnamed protein product (macronuclear) [Paramecium tetraurelia]|uniref:Uncharacterized protein n=1 Tax=Paramecium tetraurelia TaxID=5888 RepID=A0CFS9_PARTE|nr:uncharacterized protein GSPATT00038087001 [Paramecium tetraurelia]CAK69646.1 unnamed protein product [Paramecium tetraurelia]|eukprot:XP_001437043.1 hypothetical protein (macronuclear) [Paramecium tetraurelia strain d4-2]